MLPDRNKTGQSTAIPEIVLTVSEQKIPAAAQNTPGSTPSILDGLNRKHQQLVKLETELKTQLAPAIREQITCPKKWACVFGVVGAAGSASVITPIVREDDFSVFSYLYLAAMALATLWYIRAMLRRCYYIPTVLEVRADPNNMQYLSNDIREAARATIELQLQLDEIKMHENESPDDYLKLLAREDQETKHEIMLYIQRSNKRCKISDTLQFFLPAALLNFIFEYGELDEVFYLNRNKLRHLLEPIASNDYEQHLQINFFRRLADPSSNRQNSVLGERKVIEKILRFI